MVIRKGRVPRNLITLFQERGQNSRQPGMNGAYFIYTTWHWFVTLLLSIALPLKAQSNDGNKSEWVNSANVSKSSQLGLAGRINKHHHPNPLRSVALRYTPILFSPMMMWLMSSIWILSLTLDVFTHEPNGPWNVGFSLFHPQSSFPA